MSDNIVGVIKGEEKFSCFDEMLRVTHFDDALMQTLEKSGKEKSRFKIIIKPNMMVFTNPNDFSALVTDPELVEYLVDHMRDMGFRDISVCEARVPVAQMFKNHNVKFVAEQIGYKPDGRYKVVDLTEEPITFKYIYKAKNGKKKKWKDKVGRSWMRADFRITIPKCKTHEHDWMTLGLKNVYGCFPPANKVCRYHIKSEVWDVTARSLLNFPLHFSIVDAWVGSDGFQGYKINHPQELKMFFGGTDAVAVDMEAFKRAGVDPYKSHFLAKAVEQLYDGKYPEYVVKGDEKTEFRDICPWENIDDEVIEKIDILEEVYVAWTLFNMKMVAKHVDMKTFPPKNFIIRFAAWFLKKLYGVFKLFKWYRRLYERKNNVKS